MYTNHGKSQNTAQIEISKIAKTGGNKFVSNGICSYSSFLHDRINVNK